MTIPESTVYIIDDNKNFCESLSWLLSKSAKLPVSIYHDPKRFLQDYHPDWHGCLLVDILMPNMNGLELLAELNKRNNQMPIIVLTGHGDIPLAVRAIQAGAKDFITKPFDSRKLLEKIQEILKNYQEHWILNQQYKERFNMLTPREREVLNEIIVGKLNKQIAGKLGIALKTVELHRFHIMHKLQVKSVAELIALKAELDFNVK